MTIDQDTLKHLIQERGFVNENDLNAAEKVANHLGCSITDVLLGRDLLSYENLGSVLPQYYLVY